MGTIRAIKRNFTGGEVAQTIPSRDDLEKYVTACSSMKNFIAQLHGGARFRTGTYYAGTAEGFAVMIPFQFNTESEDVYQMVFTNQLVQLVQGYGFVLDGTSTVEVVTPYLEAELRELKTSVAQSGDVVYIFHRNYAPRKLERTDHTTWTLSTVTFGATQVAPTSLAAAWSGQTGGGYSINYQVTSVDLSGEESLPTSKVEVTDAYASSEWVTGDSISLSWTAASGAVEYIIYKETNGIMAYIGTTEDLTYWDDNYEGDTTTTPPVENDPFEDGNYPSCACLFQQRLWAGGSDDNPQDFSASQTANFENFNITSPSQDDNGLEFTLASGSIDQIRWMVPFGDLMIGTAGTEYYVSGGDSGAAITPTSVQAQPQSYWGSAELPPLVVGSSVLHVQRQGTTVRDLQYSLEIDGYTGNDLSVMANHLFDGHSIVSWAYQQSPDSTVWAVRDDGVLLGMTYMKEHAIWGWHQHITDGEVQDVSVLPGDEEDALYMVVKRTIDSTDYYYIEVLEPKWHESDGIAQAFYVDCGLTFSGTATDTITGLDHLEGKEVIALADGKYVGDLTVASGSVTIPFEAEVIHVGLPYTGVLATLPFESSSELGTTQGVRRSVGTVDLRLHETVCGKIGAAPLYTDVDDVELNSLPFEVENWGEAIPPYTGVKSTECSGGADLDQVIYVVQDLPLPFNLLSIIAEVEFSQG